MKSDQTAQAATAGGRCELEQRSMLGLMSVSLQSENMRRPVVHMKDQEL